MPGFKTNKIKQNSEIISEELKTRREDREIKLETVAKDLNIKIEYLQALESNDFDKLPLGSYGKNFLREYADYLGLDASELVDIYNFEIGENKKQEARENLFSRKVPKGHYFITIPKVIKNVLIIFLVIICVVYLGIYIRRIIKPPMLTTSLLNDIVIKENYIIITGKTEKEADLKINDKDVLINAEGEFKEKVDLKRGLNNITIVSKKKYSRKNIVEQRVLVEN